jgi:dTDP-glucose pyrophosphorylase
MTLLILAAGIGSRFEGLKQIQSVGENGELIIDYSIFDAIAAGFTKVVFVIRRDIDQIFRDAIFNRVLEQGKIKAEIVYQEIDDLPSGFEAPDGRFKPWGTGQAVLAARNVIHEPFCVINANDFYGPSAFVKVAKFLANRKTANRYCMVGYSIKNTIAKVAPVSRGVCFVNKHGFLVDIKEFHKVGRKGKDILDVETGAIFPPNMTVSGNIWGFTPDVFELLSLGFINLLLDNQNPMYDEFRLSVAVREMVRNGMASVARLFSHDNWFEINYREEIDKVKDAIAKLEYPDVKGAL